MINSLVKEAKLAMKNSYSPYSNFAVGAAVLLKDGTIISGCNVENASYGATNCAERSAIYTAISRGYKIGDFLEIAIISNLDTPISPCGICRQVLLEFFTATSIVHMVSKNGDIKSVELQELVPYSFSKKELEASNV